MDSKIQSLPPLKRLRLLHQHQSSSSDEDLSSSLLPAKKRKESRNLPSPPNPTTTTAAVLSLLPAKKRVWALPPEFDLNLEYNPTPQFQDPNPKPPTPASESEEEDEDDGIVCGVCESTDGDPSDPIVFCDGCDLMVHASCYGNPLIEAIPEGDWFCAKCLNNSDSDSCCCLCPVSGGALKATKDGRWAHLVCALYVPEVFFEDPVGREGIDCSRVPDRRFKQICYVCESGNGCAIKCSEPNCELAFHVTCGLNQGLSIEYSQPRSSKGVAIVAGFCKQHTQLWAKQQQTGKFKIVARDEPN